MRKGYLFLFVIVYVSCVVGLSFGSQMAKASLFTLPEGTRPNVSQNIQRQADPGEAVELPAAVDNSTPETTLPQDNQTGSTGSSQQAFEPSTVSNKSPLLMVILLMSGLLLVLVVLIVRRKRRQLR